MPNTEFKYIKCKENMLVDSLSRLRHLGLHENKDPEESGYEYGKSIFDTDENTVCSMDSDQNINNEFEINGIKCCQNEKDLANLKSQGRNAHTPNFLSITYNLDPENIKQLQQQDEHIAKLIDKCKLKKNDKMPYYLDEHDITYRKIRDGSNIFHAIMAPNTLQSYMLYESQCTRTQWLHKIISSH